MTYERNSGNTKAAFFPVRLSLVNLCMRYRAMRGNLFPMTYETESHIHRLICTDLKTNRFRKNLTMQIRNV